MRRMWLISCGVAACIALTNSRVIHADTIYAGMDGNSGPNAGSVDQFVAPNSGTILASNLYIPRGLAYSNGYLYESNNGTSMIQKISTTGVITNFASASGLEGIAFDSNGKLFAAGGLSGNIYEYSPSGAQSTFATVGRYLPGIAVDASNNVYVSDFTQNQIDKFTPAGTETVFATGVIGIVGMAFDSLGNMFAASPSTNTVDKINSAGVVSVFSTTNLSAPSGLAIDHNNNIYVVNEGNNTIEAFTPGGAASTFASGLDNPGGFIVAVNSPSAAPLPSSIGSGTALLGILAGWNFLRPKRKKASV